MPIDISLQDPEYYLDRIKVGCILDPSVFYSETYVEAATNVLSLIRPSKVYLPSNLFHAYKTATWTSFFTTLTLWSGNYEKLSSAWYQSDSLMQELSPVPIEVSEKDEKVRDIFNAMAVEGTLSPLYKTLFEITACSLENSIPILVGSHSKFRLIELLNSKLQIVVVEPLGKWAEEKKNYLTQKGRRMAVFALALMGGAWVFIEPISVASIFGGAAIASIVIDGS